MPQPTYRDIYVNRPLTNLSIAYQQEARNYIADQIFPQVPVNRQGDLYYRYVMDDWFRSMAGVRAPATESPGSGWDITTDQYYANVYSVHKDIDDQTRANADTVFDMDRDATLFVTTNLLLKRDILFYSAYMGTGIWTGGTGGAADQVGVASAPAANQFLQFNQSGSDPVNTIQTQALSIQRQTGFAPNTLVIGPSVLQALRNHSLILDRIKYTQRGIVTTDLLAALFDVDNVLVTLGVQNTAQKGQVLNMNFMSDKSMLLAYTAPNPGLMTPSAGYIFTWTGLLGAGAYGTRIKRFRIERIESDRVEGEMAFALKVVAPQLGVFFSAAVA
jgi:hypothetical protein